MSESLKKEISERDLLEMAQKIEDARIRKKAYEEALAYLGMEQKVDGVNGADRTDEAVDKDALSELLNGLFVGEDGDATNEVRNNRDIAIKEEKDLDELLNNLNVILINEVEEVAKTREEFRIIVEIPDEFQKTLSNPLAEEKGGEEMTQMRGKIEKFERDARKKDEIKHAEDEFADYFGSKDFIEIMSTKDNFESLMQNLSLLSQGRDLEGYGADKIKHIYSDLEKDSEFKEKTLGGVIIDAAYANPKNLEYLAGELYFERININKNPFFKKAVAYAIEDIFAIKGDDIESMKKDIVGNFKEILKNEFKYNDRQINNMCVRFS